MQIFISHSSRDAQQAADVCEILEHNGHSCFIAPRDIRSGYEYAEEIINGIDAAEAVLLLLSEAANESPHVLREVERAVSKSIPIIVYKLEEVQLTKSMEYFLMTHQWITGTSRGYSEILEGIRALNNPEYTPEKTMTNIDKKKRKLPKLIGAGLAAAAVIVVVILVIVTGRENDRESSSENGRDTVSDGNLDENAVDIEILEEASEPDEETDTDNQTTAGLDGETGITIKLGQEIELGTYNGERIVWRVLKLSEDGTQAVLIAKNILTFKAYDVAESGKFNYDGDIDYYSANSEAATDMELQAKVRGNSDWSGSNIRTWLNSDTEVVEYEGQKPVASAMAELKNGYQNEPGFLYGFDEEELAAIVEVENQTNGNALRENETITTRDRVYLLSEEELDWFAEAGISMLAAPTEAAVEQDETDFYQIYSLDYGVDEYIWWLREPVADSASKCYVVGNGYVEEYIQKQTVGVEGFGVRPAITVDVSKLPQ